MFTSPVKTSLQSETQTIVLQPVSWQTYRSLLTELGNNRASLISYDRGVLEIVMPSGLHEFFSRLLEAILRVLVEEYNYSLRGYGSMTLDREDLEVGAEPDSCFYIQSFSKLRGVEIDLAIDPPPDLAIEIDLSSGSSRKFSIYARLGVGELWRYTRSRGVTIYQLQNGKYLECESSPTFPPISSLVLTEWLQQADILDDIASIRNVRSWVSANKRLKN
ncbi:Uma2 family endonuclease [Tumidithrix elongata RA019]|uniref:Uma2 family endonuclease n=1 Tax=Tumidithrix elongata BACA0141 TaxID=2716417 RepID=A0AAW9Q9L9_9CYAN|nr:Uma2 family endonuclease [Tumidithrix elongata RA019]